MTRSFFLALASLTLAFTLPAFSQSQPPQSPSTVNDTIKNQINNPRLDIFGGYSHIGNYGIGQNGWIASADWHLYRYFGLEGDISAGYGSIGLGQIASLLPGVPNSVGAHMYNFNFGPNGTWRAPSGRYDAFGHVLFGLSNTNVNSAGASQGDTAFSWVLGGGADYNLDRLWAVRGQLDLVHTKFFSAGQNHGRISFGVVYRFGSHD